MHTHIWPSLWFPILKCLLGDFSHLGICASIMNINTPPQSKCTPSSVQRCLKVLMGSALVNMSVIMFSVGQYQTSIIQIASLAAWVIATYSDSVVIKETKDFRKQHHHQCKICIWRWCVNVPASFHPHHHIL